MIERMRRRKPVVEDTKSQQENVLKLKNHTKGSDVKLKCRLPYFSNVQIVSMWSSLVRFLCQPSDPSSLGVLRILYGFLMILDTVMERGMGIADSLWGVQHTCRFPLFNFLQPLPLQWMYLVYIVMLIGAFGIMLGFKFHSSCFLYLICYWYLFFLEKTSWNNHSYLFGILAFLFFMSDANRYWSIDGLSKPLIKNAHIPYWNYFVLQAQIFLVYFIAGLKKLDYDWVFGYSMQSLSVHWVFSPFKLFLTDQQIDLYIVHCCGLFIDLFVGFLLVISKTKPIGLFIATSFHFMNSQIFPIGMFPYVMLTSNLMFCSPSWPRNLMKHFPTFLRMFEPNDEEQQPSFHCYYESNVTESNDIHSETVRSAKPSCLHHTFSTFTVLFLALQCFLPYSHGITKGYNNWTNGLYGYSWDMMIHRWRLQHLRLSFYNKDTGEYGYLDPMIWTNGNHRWTAHGDIIKQFAVCVSKNLKNYNVNNVELYLDIWQSLNGRFQQRMVNPKVDILTAEWSPFKTPSFIMPLIVDLSDWRKRLVQIESALESDPENRATNVVFIADFPGLYLENYVQPDFGNTTLSVLNGQVMIQLKDTNITLSVNDSIQIPAGNFHKVYTISDTPSCYMYLYVNTSEAKLIANTQTNISVETTSTDQAEEKKDSVTNTINNATTSLKAFIRKKYNLLYRSFYLGFGALYCLVTQNSFDQFLNATYQWEMMKTARLSQ